MLNHPLQIAEYLFIVGSVIGWVIVIASGRLIYAAVPVSVSLLLNLLNRLRLQRIRRRITAAINQLHRQLLEENHSLYEQHFREAKLLWNRYANASLQTQRAEYLYSASLWS